MSRRFFQTLGLPRTAAKRLAVPLQPPLKSLPARPRWYNRLKMTSTEPGMLGEVERILQSEIFRNSEGLRRLLKFLAERTAAGQADQLKEYTIGIDGLGKPATYDTHHDAAVRIQVGRLRQKLAEYYHTEGKHDPFVIELPKGQFKLICEPRPVPEAPSPQASAPLFDWRSAARALAALSVILLSWSIYSAVLLNRNAQRINRADWTPELNQLWRGFTNSDRPVAVVIADPLFVQFKGFGAYRSQVLNSWDEITSSPSVAVIKKSLNGVEIERNRRFTNVSEANAAFLLGRTLSPHVRHLSMERSSELSWRQLADNNVLYVGAERVILNQLQTLPVPLNFTYEYDGIANHDPKPGEPALFADPPEVKARDASEDGAAFALVSSIPGPAGQGEIVTFTSNSAPARLAAVQWFTTPSGAIELVNKLKEPSGHFPTHYQIILKVKFKAGVPTETSYVRHRELLPPVASDSK